MMNDLIKKLSNLRSQFNCFNENERDAYHTLSEAIKVLSERLEPCEDDKHCSNCIYSGRPIYKSPCSECHDKSKWEMNPISRGHENGAECEDAVSREQVLKLFSTHDGKYLYEAIQILPSVTLKLDHSGDVTEMVEYDDCVSRQAVIDTARKVSSIFKGEYDTRTPYGVVLDVQDAVSKLPSVTPKAEPQWIPVTERLPEEYGNYLISIHGEDEPDIGTINPKNKRGWSLCDASGFYWASDKSLIVTAWMPFPEPYKAESEE